MAKAGKVDAKAMHGLPVRIMSTFSVRYVGDFVLIV
jgi:hypothetical protein